LKVFEAKAEQSKLWLRDRTIGKLALYSGDGVVNKASAATKEWASRSAQNGVGNSTVIDVVMIGTVNTLKHIMPKLKKYRAWSNQSVRNVFIA
jgi:hypothetical protein